MAIHFFVASSLAAKRTFMTAGAHFVKSLIGDFEQEIKNRISRPRSNNELVFKEKQIIESSIDDLIKTHRNNQELINELMTESLSMLGAGEARMYEMINRKKRIKLLDIITKKNKKLRLDHKRKIIAAQYAAQKALVILARQNLLTTRLVHNLDNRINQHDEEINQIYGMIETLAQKIEGQN